MSREPTDPNADAMERDMEEREPRQMSLDDMLAGLIKSPKPEPEPEPMVDVDFGPPPPEMLPEPISPETVEEMLDREELEREQAQDSGGRDPWDEEEEDPDREPPPMVREVSIPADPDFKPTEGQERALEMAKQIASGQGSVGIVRGYAGTGKTTMLKELIRRLGTPVLLAPTGKAALRIAESTGAPAKTIHSWLYHPFEDPRTGCVLFERRGSDTIERSRNRLVVIDEASMVQRDVWADVKSVVEGLKLNLLLVGDPFQLPPVESKAEIQKNGGKPFSVLADDFPHDGRVDLTEIMRQALGSPIIRASLALRQGNLSTFRKELPGVAQSAATAAVWEAVKGNGCVICHTNAYRHNLNVQIRKGLGRGDQIEPGEPLLVLKNNYALGRFNGEVIPFYGWEAVSKPTKVWNLYDSDMKPVPTQFGVAKLTEDGRSLAVVATARLFGNGDWMPQGAYQRTRHKAEWPDGTGKSNPNELPYLDCNLGYVLTAHKSQGSQWPMVVVIIESSVRPHKLDGRRWLYTAITRAQDKVTIFWK